MSHTPCLYIPHIFHICVHIHIWQHAYVCFLRVYFYTVTQSKKKKKNIISHPSVNQKQKEHSPHGSHLPHISLPCKQLTANSSPSHPSPPLLGELYTFPPAIPGPLQSKSAGPASVFGFVSIFVALIFHVSQQRHAPWGAGETTGEGGEGPRAHRGPSHRWKQRRHCVYFCPTVLWALRDLWPPARVGSRIHESCWSVKSGAQPCPEPLREGDLLSAQGAHWHAQKSQWHDGVCSHFPFGACEMPRSGHVLPLLPYLLFQWRGLPVGPHFSLSSSSVGAS